MSQAAIRAELENKSAALPRLRRATERTTSIAIAVLLMFSGVMKTHDFTTSSILSGIIRSRPLVASLAAAEMGLAVWLIGGRKRRATWWVVTAVFTVFAAAAIYGVWSGVASCGCFGRVKSPPWVSLVIDAAALGAWWRVRPQRGAEAEDGPGTRRWAWASAVTVGVTLVTLSVWPPARLADGSGAFAAGLVVLEPETWAGKPLPLRGHIDGDAADAVMSGRWTVVLHRHDCASCREQLPVYERRAAAGERVALVELPPYGQEERATSEAVRGRLDATREWFVQTPAEIVVQDGIVVSGRQGVGH
jgi:hypothetical protein